VSRFLPWPYGRYHYQLRCVHFDILHKLRVPVFIIRRYVITIRHTWRHYVTRGTYKQPTCQTHKHVRMRIPYVPTCDNRSNAFTPVVEIYSRSQWPRGQRRGFAAARLLGLRVRIPQEAWKSVVSVVCCQVEVSATGWSLVQRSPTDCGVSEYDREASIMRRRWSIRGCRAKGRGGEVEICDVL
jgi:hypothetical protein